ncbi:MAG: hypothetical protein GX924_07670 [Clostridiaceae bacterium]|nr:hypothetical protein [Clostridiaceae bacterium]
MYKLERLNVVRLVDSELKAKALIDEGFTLVEEPKEVAAGVKSDAESNVSNLKKMTLTELKDYAAEKGVDLGEAAKKADIVALLTKEE